MSDTSIAEELEYPDDVVIIVDNYVGDATYWTEDDLDEVEIGKIGDRPA